MSMLSKKRCPKSLQPLCLVAVLAIAAPAYGGEFLLWDVTAQCDSASPDKAVLTLSCSETLNCLEKAVQLYGCGSTCSEDNATVSGATDEAAEQGQLLLENIVWTEKTCSCTCAVNDKVVSCDQQDSCEHGVQGACQLSAKAELDLPCETLAAYTTVCSEPRCPQGAFTMFFDGDYEHNGGNYPNTCASSLGFDPAGFQPTPDCESEDAAVTEEDAAATGEDAAATGEDAAATGEDAAATGRGCNISSAKTSAGELLWVLCGVAAWVLRRRRCH